jgi:hypothetical protein
LSERLEAIDAAIRRAPDSAENYLLRAEVLLDRGRRGDELAAAVDLYRALMLAERQIAEADWGISLQITRDQARTLLDELAERGIVIDIRDPDPETQTIAVVDDLPDDAPDPDSIPEPYPLTGGLAPRSDDFENVPSDGTMQATMTSDDPGRRTME